MAGGYLGLSMASSRNDGIERRQVLVIGLGTALTLAGWRPALAKTGRTEARSLCFQSLHTGERLRATYWEKGRYLPDALAEIDRVLRDHRTGEVARIDTGLLDLLHDLGCRLECDGRYEVISGYRSPATNAALQRAGHGVARRSLHMDGQAIDIRVRGRDLAALRRAAVKLGRGGVGYYPRSGFVHVDVGRVRTW